jgi:hypothetical protein
MSVRKLRSGRITTITAAQFVGQEGTLFWDEPAGLLRLSDGSTPGGKIVGNLALASTGITPPINPFEGELWYNPSTKELLAYYDAEFRGTINLATETVLGGVRLGPGVITNSNGQIIIDSSGLEFSFGDFAATDNRIQTINTDQDAIILSNGTGAVRIVGEFFVHPTNGEITDYSDETYLFGVGADGQVKIFVPDTDPLEGAMEIIGTSSGESVTPAVAGVMLHITGNNNVASSIYNDGVNRNPNFIGRRYNGTALEPTQVLANDVITRFSGQGYALGGFSGAASATVSLDALENFTATNQGSEVKILTTPLGAAARAQVARFNNQEGLALKKVTLEGSTSGTVSVQATATSGTNTITLPAATGTVITTAGSNTVTGVLAGTISVDPAQISSTSSSVQTFTLTGLTTNHRIVLTSGTALGYGVLIAAAWASAADTLSVEFHNITNQPINPAAKTLQYFAWI